MRIILFILASFYLSADDHEQSFEGLLSSERFNIDGGMELVIEKRSTCNAGNLAKALSSAAGTVVYMFWMVLSQNPQASGNSIQKVNIGLKDLIGFTEVRPMHQI